MYTTSDTFTTEELAIIQALRCCPESRLGREFPPTAELSLTSVALLLGLHPAAARRLLRRGLSALSLSIGADAELCRLIAHYYNIEEPTIEQ